MNGRFVMRRRSDAATEQDLKPGEYRQCRKAELYGDTTYAIWRCPYCTDVSSVNRRIHNVDHEGNIYPSSICPHKHPDGTPCAFHEWVHLENWVPEAEAQA